MPMPVEKVALRRCYQTSRGEVRQVVSFDGDHVLYVVEHNNQVPVWNKFKWLRISRKIFAEEVAREVPGR
jgi:hypothetical protein